MFSQATSENQFGEFFGRSKMVVDSGSTHHGFNTSELLVDIHEVEYPLESISNVGVRYISRIGTFGDINDVWHDPGSLANILSLSMLCRHYRVQFDNASMDGFRLHKGNGEEWQFREFASGLHYFDLNNSNKRTLTEYSLLNTVSDLEKQYSKKQVT